MTSGTNKGHFGPNRPTNRLTLCKWGHALDGEYTRLLADGTRKCCICENARSAHLINERLNARSSWLGTPFKSRKKQSKMPKHSLFYSKKGAKQAKPLPEDSELSHADWMRLHGIRGPRGF